MSATDGWGIVEALGSIAGGVVLVGGAFVGVRYGRRAVNLRVEAVAHRDEGGLLLIVRPAIASAGVLPVKLKKGKAPVRLRVYEVLRAKTGGVERGAFYTGRAGLFESETIRGSEIKSTAESFALAEPEGLIGWFVDLAVQYKGVPLGARTYEPVPPKGT